MIKENYLKIQNLSFKYPGTKKENWHLDNISINISKGEWTTILGPNGSGKSTLAKSIVRINKFKKGNIFINNKALSEYKAKDFAKFVAYIPQVLEVPHGTSVYDFISFGRNPYLGLTGVLKKDDKKVIKHAMKKTQTWKWKNKMMDELSGGQRQKVLIAMVVVQDSSVIILDEPTTYLDIRNQYELLEMMHHQHVQGKTIITILHDINQAVQYSDKIFLMKNGKIFKSGTPDEVINSETLKNVYGVDAKLYKDGKRKYITDIKLIDFEFGSTSDHRRTKVHTE